MRLILLGAPGAGKGTQAGILSSRLGIPVISTGNILRAAIKQGTHVGLKAREYVENGKLVPDDVIIGIVEERLAESDCAGGYILDGMPRTIPQAEHLERDGVGVDCALCIDVDDRDDNRAHVRAEDLPGLRRQLSRRIRAAQDRRYL